MLKNAIAPIQALRVIVDQSNQLKMYLRINLKYEVCSNLLLSIVTNYDAQFKTNRSNYKSSLLPSL